MKALGTILLLALLLPLQLATAQQATVMTDYPDYYPGDTVRISGDYWQANESVLLVIEHYNFTHPNDTLYATANSGGHIFNEQFIIQLYDLGEQFTLNATGLTSNYSAQTTFTDGAKVGSVDVLTQIGTLCAGTAGSATFQITVNRATGATGSITATMTVTTVLPTGMSAAFSPSSVSLSPSQSAGTTVLTISTTSGTPSGVTNFTVKAAAATNDWATNTQNVTVSSLAPVSVSISAVPGTTICAGNSVTFTATPTNGGNTPAFQWKLNGTDIPGATASTYTSTSLAHNDVVTCVLTSNATCATGSPATSNALTMVVNPLLPAGVSIAASPGLANFAGATVTFTATPTNGGPSPSYQWKLNGTNVGTNSATYQTTALVHGDEVSCVMTSNATCATGSPATSNTLTMTVKLRLDTPAANATLCAGTPMNITWTGGDPAWNIYLSLVDNATNAAALTIAASTGNDGAETWNIPTTLPAGSYHVYVQKAGDILYYDHGGNITINAPPAVTTQPTDLTVCEGLPASFTVAGYGTPAPTIQWQVSTNSGSSWADLSGETSATLAFSSATVSQSGYQYHAVLTNSCATAVSNPSVLTVNPSQPVSVSIAANPGTTICAGTSVTFTATPTNEGSSPSYQWKLNGADITGATGTTYTSTALVNSDIVTCVLTSNATCATGSPATSNPLTMIVNPLLPVSVSISANPGTSINAGTSVTFTAVPANGGTTPSYQWKVDGSNVGTNSATYTSSTLQYGNVVTCEMTSSEACATGSPATSNTLNMQVNYTFSAPGAAMVICSGTQLQISWTGGDPTANVALHLIDFSTSPGTSTAVISAGTANDGSETWPIPANVPPGTHYSIHIANVSAPTQYFRYSDQFTINTPALVAVVPQNQTVCEGAQASFTSTASGTPAPTVQWQLSVNGAKTASDSNGETNTTLTLASTAAAQNGYKYHAVFTNSCNVTVSLPQPTLTVNTAPQITQQPVDATICPGGSASFSVVATGTGLQYQWYHRVTPIINTNSATLSLTNLPPSMAGTFHVVISGTCGTPATSDPQHCPSTLHHRSPTSRRVQPCAPARTSPSQ